MFRSVCRPHNDREVLGDAVIDDAQIPQSSGIISWL